MAVWISDGTIRWDNIQLKNWLSTYSVPSPVLGVWETTVSHAPASLSSSLQSSGGREALSANHMMKCIITKEGTGQALWKHHPKSQPGLEGVGIFPLTWYWKDESKEVREQHGEAPEVVDTCWKCPQWGGIWCEDEATETDKRQASLRLEGQVKNLYLHPKYKQKSTKCVQQGGVDEIIKDHSCYSVKKRIWGKQEQKLGNQLGCDTAVVQGRDDSS